MRVRSKARFMPAIEALPDAELDGRGTSGEASERTRPSSCCGACGADGGGGGARWSGVQPLADMDGAGTWKVKSEEKACGASTDESGGDGPNEEASGNDGGNWKYGCVANGGVAAPVEARAAHEPSADESLVVSDVRAGSSDDAAAWPSWM